MSLDFSDLQSAKGYNGLRVLRPLEARQYPVHPRARPAPAGTEVTANCLHPGVVATRFGDSSGGFAGGLIRFLRLFFISPGGRRHIIYLASSPEVETTTGQYFVKRRVTGTVHGGARRRRGEAALDRER